MNNLRQVLARMSDDDLQVLAKGGGVDGLSDYGLQLLAGENPELPMMAAHEPTTDLPTIQSGNPFDQFDEKNPFDKFDKPATKITKVEAPDGHIVKVQHPVGATGQQIMDYAKKNYTPNKLAPWEKYKKSGPWEKYKKAAMLTEADKRGLLTGKKNKTYDEAVKRGLIMPEFDPTLGQGEEGAAYGSTSEQSMIPPEYDPTLNMKDTRGIASNHSQGAPDIDGGQLAENAWQTTKDTGNLAMTMAQNFPGDAIELLNETGKAFMHPVETANALGNLVLGALQKAIPGEQGQEIYIDQVLQSIKDTIGTREKLNDFLANHPAKTMAMLPVAGGAVGGSLSAAGKLSKAPQLANAGRAITQATSKADPLSLAARGATAATRKAGDIAAESLGAATGAGTEAIKQAANSSGLTSRSNPFVSSMRGNTSLDDTVHNAQNALKGFKEKRSAKIRAELEGLSKNNTYIDLRPIKKRVQNLMKRYNIKLDADNNLDFSRSAIDRNARGDIEAIIQDVSEWGMQKGDNTPTGLHILKQRLDDFYSENKNSRAFVTELRNQVKNEIVKTVPAYAKMMKDYEKATGSINQIERALSLSDRAMMDTAIKKLISTNRENFEFRKALLSELEANSGTNLAGEIAGHAMNQAIPKGLIGKLAAAGVGGAAFTNPWVLSLLPMTSPRLVGELLVSVGYPAKEVLKFVKVVEKSKLLDPRIRNAAAMTQQEGQR